MQLITWTAAGLGGGWFVRTGMRSRRDFGLLGDLTTGWLGGVVSGSLFRQLGVVDPDAEPHAMRDEELGRLTRLVEGQRQAFEGLRRADQSGRAS